MILIYNWKRFFHHPEYAVLRHHLHARHLLFAEVLPLNSLDYSTLENTLTLTINFFISLRYEHFCFTFLPSTDLFQFVCR